MSNPPTPLRKVTRVIVVAVVAVATFLALGNAAIAAAWKLQSAGDTGAPFTIAGVNNFRVVDGRVWRGAAPSAASFRDLAAKGVTTVVDLRAEDNIEIDEALLAELGVTRVHIPIRDGQIPSSSEVARFLAAVDESAGPVFVHCGAGVGRTGAMVAAYQVATGNLSGPEAMADNLAVGPPSLEQLVFAAGLDEGVRRPPALVVGASRVLDAPRRLMSILL